MFSSTPSYYQLESMILNLDPAAHDCRVTIADIRRAMDAACDNRTITIRQWRALLENISVVQARCSSGNKDDIWKPAVRPNTN